MPDYLKIPRFPLPANWNPTGVQCVMFTIPDDQEYLSTIIGLVGMLKWSTNFARDETKTGAAIVARTWEHALYSNPVTTVDCEEGMPIFRINPSTCLLEVLCGETWQPVVTPAYDPRDVGDPIVPFPEPPTEFSGACTAADRAADAVIEAANALADDLINGLVFGQILANFLSGVVSILVQIGMDFVYPQLTQMIALISVVQLQADKPSFPSSAFRELVNCYYDENGVITGDGYASLLDAIQDIIDTSWVYQHDPLPTNELWKVVHFVVLMAGRTGMQRAALYNDDEIETCDCEWRSIAELYIDSNVYSQFGAGTWGIGQGWRTDGSRSLHIRYLAPETIQLEATQAFFRSDQPVDSSHGGGIERIEVWNDGAMIMSKQATGTFLNESQVSVGSQTELGQPFILADEVRVYLELPEEGDGYQDCYRVGIRGTSVKPIEMP